MFSNIVQPLVCKKGDEASPSIILAGLTFFCENAHNLNRMVHLVQILYTIMGLNIVQPLVCKNMTRLHRASVWPVELIL